MLSKVQNSEEFHSSLFYWEIIGNAFAFLANILNNQPNEMILAELYQSSNKGSFLEKKESPYQLISLYLKNNQNKPTAELLQELAIDWTRLFRGVSPSYGPQPPYAGVYYSEDGVGVHTMTAITHIFASHDLSPKSDKHNRVDYLGVLLEFVSILSNRAAQEAELGNLAAVESLRVEILNFLENYISPWLNTFIDQALEYAKTDFFKGYLGMLSESIKETITLIKIN